MLGKSWPGRLARIREKAVALEARQQQDAGALRSLVVSTRPEWVPRGCTDLRSEEEKGCGWRRVMGILLSSLFPTRSLTGYRSPRDLCRDWKVVSPEKESRHTLRRRKGKELLGSRGRGVAQCEVEAAFVRKVELFILA